MRALRWLTRVGPAFVIAAVVLGPGSVTTMSKMGAKHGYAMLWLPLLAGVLMAGFVTLFMRFGISTQKSLLQHCADTWGRGFAVLVGISLFYIATAFQFGNNIGVSTALSSLLTPRGAEKPPVPEWVWPLVFNALALAFLFAFRRLYAVVEKSMTVLVAVMLVAFLTNLFFARPRASGIAAGLVPSVPEGLDLLVAAGLVATTFSIVGAMFQSYMVRARGWTEADYGEGVADSLSGIGMLTLISLVIMITSAAVLHPRGVQIQSAADMAGQLDGLLGAGAKLVFCIGFGCAAFSSFLVNAMIGGTLLSDGLGLSDAIDSRSVRVCSAASLIAGMVVAVLIQRGGTLSAADALVAGQAGTLLAVPLALAATVVVFFLPGRSRVKPLGTLAKGFVLVGLAVLAVNAVGSYLGFIRRFLVK